MPCLLAEAEASCFFSLSLSLVASRAPEARSVRESLPGTLPLACSLLASLEEVAAAPWTDSAT